MTRLKCYMSHVMIEKIYLTPYANNNDADQPAQPGSKISTFVVCCLDRIIAKVAVYTKPRPSSF